MITFIALGAEVTATDQAGTVHAFEYDELGRPVADRVTTLGSGVDDAVRRVETAYDVRGLVTEISSFNHPEIGQGDVVNQVERRYNGFGQLTTEFQSHAGAVNEMTTPKVEYAHADGTDNTVRPVSVTYPNGREIRFDYGTTDGIDDASSRVVSLVDDDTTHLTDYSYLGAGTVVIADRPQPQVKFTLVDLAENNDPDTGDIYSGLDRFGRVKDNRWYDYDEEEDVDRIQYGYDRAGNRLWRENTVATDMNKDFDELYQYDGLYRLADIERGLLNAQKDGLTTCVFKQDWALDPTGNWNQFRQADSNCTTFDLVQDRTANPVNEITDIDNTTGPSWITPAYDPAGNMTLAPSPIDPGDSDQDQTYTWDAWNRLVDVEADETTLARFQYDALGRRIVKSANGIDHHYYLNDQNQILEEQTDDGQNGPTLLNQFVWDINYIDALAVRDDHVADQRYYPTRDANFNVTAVVDENGDVQERYAYAAYGSPTFFDADFANPSATSTTGQENLFTGRQLDPETGLYYYRARYYHPILGIFISRDSLIYVDGANGYTAYFVPLHVDPTGFARTIIQGEIGPVWYQILFPQAGTLLPGECGKITIRIGGSMDCTDLASFIPVPPFPLIARGANLVLKFANKIPGVKALCKVQVYGSGDCEICNNCRDVCIKGDCFASIGLRGTMSGKSSAGSGRWVPNVFVGGWVAGEANWGLGTGNVAASASAAFAARFGWRGFQSGIAWGTDKLSTPNCQGCFPAPLAPYLCR